MNPSAEERGLWDRIRADPDDDAARLVYADWLLDRGDPAGEYIALACELQREDWRTPRGSGLFARLRRLEPAWRERWLARLRPRVGEVAHVELRRGLPEGVAMSAGELLAFHAELAETLPLFRWAMPTGPRGDLDALLEGPVADRLEILRVDHWQTSELAELATYPRLRGLRELDVTRTAVYREQLDELAHSPALSGVRRLRLDHCNVRDVGATVLRYANLPQLVELSLAGGAITRFGVEMLAQRRWRRLSLATNAVGNAGAEALGASAALAGLETLELRDADIGPSGVFALAASPHLSSLRVLDLSQNPIGEGGVQALASSPFLSRDLLLICDEPWATLLGDRFVMPVP